jgi:hypothetical protein
MKVTAAGGMAGAAAGGFFPQDGRSSSVVRGRKRKERMSVGRGDVKQLFHAGEVVNTGCRPPE